MKKFIYFIAFSLIITFIYQWFLNSQKQIPNKVKVELNRKNKKTSNEVAKRPNDLDVKEREVSINQAGSKLNLLNQNLTNDYIRNLSTDNFIEFISEVEERIPSKSELRSMTDSAVHHTPANILEAGLNIGKIKKILRKRPDFYDFAKDFFKKCSLKKSSPDTVRALCLNNLKTILTSKGEEVDSNEYTENILFLSKELEDLE